MANQDTAFDEKALQVSADDALAALEAAGARAVALVDAWVKRGNAAAVAEASERATGAARKAARRGIGVLKSRGVQIPERARTASLAGPKSEETVEAWLMPPDTAGNTLLVVTSHAKASRHKSVFVVLHDSHGVYRVDVAELSQTQLRESMQKALPGAHYRPVRVPLPWVRYRIAEARKVQKGRGAPEPLGFTSARALLEPVPSEQPTHPFDDEGFELSDEDAKSMSESSATLHTLPEFRGWFPTRSAVEEMLAKVGETVPPGEEPDPAKLKGALEEELVASTDRYFTPERRGELVRAMKDSALSVLSRDGESKALEVAAAMSVIANRGLITDAPHEVGFLKGFFEKAVSLLLAQGGGSLRIPVRKAVDPGAGTPGPEAARSDEASAAPAET